MKALLLIPPHAVDGPVLGESISTRAVRLLAAAGVDRIAAVCPPGYPPLPQRAGVRLIRREYDPALGTAGAVRSCAELVGSGDFWLVDGGAVWLLELSAAVQLHRTRGAAATLVLSRRLPGDRRAAVACDRLGRVTYFEARPPLDRCRSMAVYAGLALCSPAVFDRIPRAGRVEELFPALLEGGRLWGAWTEGYCRRVTDRRDLLDCGVELLSRGGDPRLDALRRRAGIYSASPLPDGVDLIPPCWLGEGVTVGPGSLLGPHAVLERGASVGARSLVQRSLVDGGAVGDWCTLYGAVVCPDARTGKRCVLNEGVILGEHSRLPDGTLLEEGTAVEARPAGGDEKSLYFF